MPAGNIINNSNLLPLQKQTATEPILQTPNPSPQKIPFWRRRWFWGAVMGLIIIFLSYQFIISVLDCPLQSVFDKFIIFFSSLAYGFFVGIFFPFIILHLIKLEILSLILKNMSILGVWSVGFFFIIYYLFLLFLLYKTFKNKKVKIKYAVIFILVILLSFAGGVIKSFYQHC